MLISFGSVCGQGGRGAAFGSEGLGSFPVAKDVQRKSPLELFDELYQLQNNQPMSERQRSFTLELIESIWEGSL